MKRSAIRGIPKADPRLRSTRKSKKPPGLASGLQAAGKIKLSIRHAEHARKRLTEALQNH
jgi:hypothetical protein